MEYIRPGTSIYTLGYIQSKYIQPNNTVYKKTSPNSVILRTFPSSGKNWSVDYSNNIIDIPNGGKIKFPCNTPNLGFVAVYNINDPTIFGYARQTNMLGGKKVRKHQGINQTGGNVGRLRKGYRYSGKRLKSGLPQIVKCKSRKK